MNILIMGVQGSGKGTHGKNIADRYGMVHISTGDLLRRHIERGTKIGKEYEVEYKQGKLASDSILFQMIYGEISKFMIAQQGFVLDGFPRTLKQLNWFKKHGYGDNCIVMHLEIPRQEAVQRMKERGRIDDNDEAIQKRLNNYYKNTHPIISFYETQGNVYTVSSDQPIDSTFIDIQKELETFDFFRGRAYDPNYINI